MAKKLGSRTITVIRKAKVDRLSSTPTSAPPEHDVKGCSVLPRTSFEQDKGWTIVEGRQIIAPYGADVLATDQVRVDGLVWNVDGEPGEYEDKKARGKATIFYLTRVT